MMTKFRKPSPFEINQTKIEAFKEDKPKPKPEPKPEPEPETPEEPITDSNGNAILDLYKAPRGHVAVNVCTECGFIARKDTQMGPHESEGGGEMHEGKWRFWVLKPHDGFHNQKYVED